MVYGSILRSIEYNFDGVEDTEYYFSICIPLCGAL